MSEHTVPMGNIAEIDQRAALAATVLITSGVIILDILTILHHRCYFVKILVFLSIKQPTP